MGFIIPSGASSVKINHGFTCSVSENRYKKYGIPSVDFLFTSGTIENIITSSEPITFTRNSLGTYYDSFGFIKTASANEPRFNHNPLTGEKLGFLVEESRTNSQTYNTNFATQWSFGGSGTGVLYPNSDLAPDESFTASKLAAQSSRYIVGPTNSGMSTPNTGVYFDLSNGTYLGNFVGTPASYGIIPAGNGWYRVYLVVSGYCGSIFAKAGELSQIAIQLLGSNFYIYSRDGGTGNVSNGIYIWGAQVEQGFFPTSYIPTPVTFTGRASIATYYDLNGNVSVASTNVGRTDSYFPDQNGSMISSGLLLESSSTNLIPHSEQFGLYSATEVDIIPNDFLAPDLSFTAGSITETTATNYHELFLYPITTTGSLTISGFIKNKQGTRNALLRFNDGVNDTGFYFNPSSGSIVGILTGAGTTAPSNYGVQKLSNDWYRIYVSGNVSSSGGESALHIIDNTTYSTHTGNGSDGFYVWGFQMEQTNYPTSYIENPATFFSRSQTNANTASYYQSNGIIGYASTDIVRDNAYLPDNTGTFYPVGTLLEEERTNLLTYSEDFSQWTLTSISVATNNTTSPDGTNTADRITNTANETGMSRTVSSYSGQHIISVYAKYSGTTNWLRITSGIGNPEAWFDINNGVVGTQNNGAIGKIQNVGNGWYRCSIKGNFSSSTSVGLIPSSANGSTTEGNGNSLYLWGAQLEQGSFLTSYIYTDASTATRGRDFVSSGVTLTRSSDTSTSSSQVREADDATIDGASYSSLFDSHPTGTVYCEYNREYSESIVNTTNRVWTFSRGSTNNNVQIRCDGSGNEGFYIVDGGTTSSVGITPVLSRGIFRKTACAWDNTTMSSSFEGVGISTTTMNSSLPFANSITEFSVGSYPAFGSHLNGNIKRLTYWKNKLSNTQLERLTQ